MSLRQVVSFFFNDTATTEIYTLSLHDALPISTFLLPVLVDLTVAIEVGMVLAAFLFMRRMAEVVNISVDRKSTRLNSNSQISYAVFCLKTTYATAPPLPSARSARASTHDPLAS